MHHRLYQQAITMLQENMITFFLEQEKLGWGVKTNRDAVSNAIRITCLKERTVDDEKPEAELIHRLLSNPLIKAFAPDLEALRMLRNDVNHGIMKSCRNFLKTSRNGSLENQCTCCSVIS
jgi:hypothetical protein